MIEPLIIFASAYLCYVLAETIHWSGILALIGCGIVQKRYAFMNISQKSYTTVKYGIKTIASFSDCIIFLFLGIVTISHGKEWHTGEGERGVQDGEERQCSVELRFLAPWRMFFRQYISNKILANELVRQNLVWLVVVLIARPTT